MFTNQTKTYLFSIFPLVAFLLSACQITLVDPAMAKPNPTITNNAAMHVFGNSEIDIPGATSVLKKNAAGIELTVDTTELTPGDAYTIWWVIFNNSTACADATCKGSDLSNPETVGMVGYATGGIADVNGVAHFEATLSVGDNSIALDNNDGFPFELVEPAPGLIDPMAAEIHAVVRTHGAALDDPTEQITTFGGGCNPECTNVQAALHLPESIALQ
ncbi:hypothetical protein KFU94_33700 [Chloroflexi bacterium TSY]|nr:hypothetical protein [Chloroflexi bacterium TSY]